MIILNNELGYIDKEPFKKIEEKKKGTRRIQIFVSYFPGIIWKIFFGCLLRQFDRRIYTICRNMIHK